MTTYVEDPCEHGLPFQHDSQDGRCPGGTRSQVEMFDEWWVGPNRYDTLTEARAAQRRLNDERMVDWADRCLVEKVEEIDEFGPKGNWERYHYRKTYEAGPLPIRHRRVTEARVFEAGEWGKGVPHPDEVT